MGFFEMSDLAGGDVGWRLRKGYNLVGKYTVLEVINNLFSSPHLSQGIMQVAGNQMFDTVPWPTRCVIKDGLVKKLKEDGIYMTHLLHGSPLKIQMPLI